MSNNAEENVAESHALLRGLGWVVTLLNEGANAGTEFEVWIRVPLLEASAAKDSALTSYPGRTVVSVRRMTMEEGEREAESQAQLAESARRHSAHEEAMRIGRFGSASSALDAAVPTSVWANTLDEDGKETGFIGRVRGRTLGEIAKDLHVEFKKLAACESGDLFKSPFDGEGFSVCFWSEHEGKKGNDIVWPGNVWRVMCYATTGGSEGHYAHVDLLLAPPPYSKDPAGHLSVFQCKTFRGHADAYAIASKFAELLGA